ncbi:DM13 domain-containing protein [Antiquaquibacter soli]|uniref:DM13 domain-containing protein n=1 Tax=Antiquaquibacter soli TaxID=3064523 RepID=A0ABT9BPK3_9MICO|nr:DM13 domain-containing protein [Protaetiibacter sp. WY-16]MDO7881232.1 DM13 domain-containing protein [Protaetiibacter sp. WY-16]
MRRWIVGSVAVVAAAGLIVGAVVFQPWLLFVNVAVDDALPPVATAPAPTSTSPAEPSASPTPAVAVELSTGALISHEHDTTGTVSIIENPDGSRVLALENLATSSGPDVHVWLASTPVVEGVDGWFLGDDGPVVDLGPIKGNLGNQVYDIPADVDLSAYPAVYLWCVQFAVSFGAAPLAPAGG